MEQDRRVILTDEDGNQIPYTVLADTVLQGRTYLLVTQSGEDEAMTMCEILVEVGDEGDYLSYEFVENEEELENIFKVFETLLSEEDMEV